MWRILALCVCFLGVKHLEAQQLLAPLTHHFNWDVEQLLAKPSETHSAVRPLTIHQLDLLRPKDSLEYDKPRSWIYRKAFKESLFKVDSSDFRLQVDPVLNLSYGNDFGDSAKSGLYTNTRGILIRGSIGSDLSFESSFYENQAFFPEYVNQYVDYHGVVPGSGRTKPFKTNGYDYSMASGYISYRPSENFIVQAGHGKNFIGEGYRSLYLSDVAFNYPYLKAQALFWEGRIMYTSMVASIRELVRLPSTQASEPQFVPKQLSLNYVSYKPVPIVEIGVFESRVYQRWDSTLGSLAPNFSAYIPLFGVKTLAGGDDAIRSNGFLGAAFKVNPVKGFVMYAQYVQDDWSENRGHNVGMKLAGLGLKNLFLRAEYTWVSEKNFGSARPFQSYSHYGQPLAHLKGKNFREVVIQGSYSWKRIFAIYHSNTYNFRNDSFLSQEGQDVRVYKPRRAESTKVAIQHVQLGYIINPATNLNVSISYLNRIETGEFQTMKTGWFNVNLRTTLSNLYFDF